MLLTSFAVFLCFSFVESQDCECGFEGGRRKREANIFGGIPAGIERYPWIVYFRRPSSPGYVSTCTGFVISSRWVMIAAHCVPRNLNVRGMEVLLQQDCGTKRLPTGSGYAVRRAIRHPRYQDGVGNLASQTANDIALLELRAKLPDDLLPICMDYENTFDNLFTAGWGKTGSGPNDDSPCLMEAQMAIQDISACRLPRKTPKNLVLCAGGGETNVCHGDSGGALMTRKNDRVYAAALVSNGPPCDEGYPSVFERVAPHLQWVQQTTNNAICIG